MERLTRHWAELAEWICKLAAWTEVAKGKLLVEKAIVGLARLEDLRFETFI
jgi:hypothetical protein